VLEKLWLSGNQLVPVHKFVNRWGCWRKGCGDGGFRVETGCVRRYL